MAIEVDILPIAKSNDETARLAELIEGVAGEFSPFEELQGFSIDGVDLPDGWRDRLVKVQNANTADNRVVRQSGKLRARQLPEIRNRYPRAVPTLPSRRQQP